MFLENLGIDALDPLRLGRFWEEALGTITLTAEPDIFETRLDIDGNAYLDLCFAQVPVPNGAPLRLHLDVRQDEAPWIVLGDPEGTPFRVREEREAHVNTGPLAALQLDSADPWRDAEFWAWLSGWVPVAGSAPCTLRHPSRRGPGLELVPEAAPKQAGAKNPIHLDIRLEPEDDADEVAAGIQARGGRELHPDWGELPWRVFQDPSGNELCVLPAVGSGA